MEEGSLRGRVVGTLVIGLFALLIFSSFAGRLAPADSGQRATATPSGTARSSATAPTPDMLHSVLVTRASDPTIAVGTTATIELVFKNTGTATWTKGGPSEIRLGVLNDDTTFVRNGMAVSWPLETRPAVQKEPAVPPGSPATFTFDVKGSRAGTFKLPLRPVVDGVAWLEDPNLVITVTVK